MKIIQKSELKNLLKCQEKLLRLEATGVDNWIGYDIALSENDDYGKDYRTWKEVDLDGLLDEYEDLDHYIEFNY